MPNREKNASLLAPLALSGALAPGAGPASELHVKQHLYVADDINDRIVEFPIKPNGLPSLTPDNVLNIHGPPFGLAFDKAGNLYVSILRSPADVIEIFGPGATGNERQKRTIPFGGSGPVFLAVDDKDHLFVDVGNYTINVYTLTSPLRLIATIPIPNLINDMLVDRTGSLFVSEIDEVGVFLQPLVRQTPDGVVHPQGGYEFSIFGSIAIDDESGTLFFNFFPQDNSPWSEFDFATRKLPGYADTRSAVDPMILSKACTNSGTTGTSYGAAVSSHYFMAGCVGNTPGSVFVYDKDAYGRRAPVEVVGPGYVQSVGNIKVGP